MCRGPTLFSSVQLPAGVPTIRPVATLTTTSVRDPEGGPGPAHLRRFSIPRSVAPGRHHVGRECPVVKRIGDYRPITNSGSMRGAAKRVVVLSHHLAGFRRDERLSTQNRAFFAKGSSLGQGPGLAQLVELGETRAAASYPSGAVCRAGAEGVSDPCTWAASCAAQRCFCRRCTPACLPCWPQPPSPLS